MQTKIGEIFKTYDHVSWGTKLFILIRLLTAPFFELEKQIPRSGKILDLGCGHGLFSVILYLTNNNRIIVGIDPDKNKISATKDFKVDVSQLQFSTSSIKSLIKQKKKFDTIVISDVVYLLSNKDVQVLLSSCKSLLTKTGKLYIKTSQKDSSVGHKLAVAQEKVMVQLLKKTHSKEQTLYFRTIKEYRELFAKIDLKIIKELSLHTFFFHPHYLFILKNS